MKCVGVNGRRDSKAAMHRIANPFTAVRLRLAPPQNSRAGVAQLVERNLAKVEVASSRLVSRSKISFFSLRLFVRQ